MTSIPLSGTELYPVDPTIQDHLSLKSFSENFDIKDFISSLSEKLILQSQTDPGPFDPKPFIRTFDAAVDNLISLRRDVQRKTEHQEQSTRNAEKDYSNKLADLNRGFESVGKSFTGMENKINQVGRAAIRIGEQLESVHLSRQRAQAAHDLVFYWNQFARGDIDKIETLRKDGKEGRHQVAVLLRRLNAVAKDLDVKGAEKARPELDRYCEKFEKDMLRMFDKSYRKGDPKIMKHCAQTLLEFNGGTSCVQIYVNQHDFFISGSRMKESTSIEETHLWEVLPDPNASVPKKELGLAALLDEIRITVGQEAQIIQAVFPNPPVVMQVFLQRVFEQSLQQTVEHLLDKAGKVPGSLAFLRVLQMVHVQIAKLVSDLKVYDLSSSTSSSRDTDETSSTELRDARGASGPGPAIPIATMLDNALEEIFIQYIEGNKYTERETRSLGEMYANFLGKFSRYHAAVRTKNSGGLLDRMVTQFTGASGNSLAAAAASSSASSAFAKLSGMASSMKLAAAASYPSVPIPQLPATSPVHDQTKPASLRESINETDGLISVDAAEKMLKWHAEAIGRCVELSPVSEVPKNVFALSRTLAEALAVNYVETALETALVTLDARDTRQGPELAHLRLVRSIDLISQLWQQYVSIALVPLATPSMTTRREMMVFNSHILTRIESQTNILEQRLLDGVILHLSAQLMKQKKTDFKPRNDDVSFTRVNTEPCSACCEALLRVQEGARESLTGENLDNFLTEIGIVFNTMLLEHLKKFPVSATGGLMLAKDLKSYQDTIACFGIAALDERFEFLRQLGNVFLVRPEVLKTYVGDKESPLGQIDAPLLRPYLSQRADWGQIGFDAQSTAGNPGSESLGGSSFRGLEVKGLRDKMGMPRLSAMMKELEALRTYASTAGNGITSGIPSTGTMPPAGSGLSSLSFTSSHNT